MNPVLSAIEVTAVVAESACCCESVRIENHVRWDLWVELGELATLLSLLKIEP